MSSQKGANWMFYSGHRLNILENGIFAYTTDKYTRLSFDKHVKSNKVCDTIAGMLINKKPTLIHMAKAPNLPIGLIKDSRCFRVPQNALQL